MIYGADLEKWLRHSVAHTYADDTKSGATGKNIEEVKQKLEEDASNVLRFMASNGLKANASKTTLMLINGKQKEKFEIKVGEANVIQENSAKLLGVIIEDDQKWTTQITGKGGVIPSLNSRLYMLKRIKNNINQNKLKKVADSIWTSKLRYGLQLYGAVRTKDSDPTNGLMTKLQVTQNKLLRVLENVNLADGIHTKTLLENQNMLSVNQLAGQIKLNEMWKATNVKNYAIKVNKQTTAPNGRATRGDTSGKLIEPGKSSLVINSCIGDSTRLWNQAPQSVKNCTTIWSAKKEIRKYAATLPI